MDFIRVGQGKLGLVVAKLLWGGDTQLVQGWLQLLKIQSQSLHCTVLLTQCGESLQARNCTLNISYLFIYKCFLNISSFDRRDKTRKETTPN